MVFPRGWFHIRVGYFLYNIYQFSLLISIEFKFHGYFDRGADHLIPGEAIVFFVQQTVENN